MDKMCSKCGETKPATSEYFAPIKKYNSLDSRCRECKYKIHRQWILDHPNKQMEYGRRAYIKDPGRYKATLRRSYKKNIDKRRIDSAIKRSFPEYRDRAIERELKRHYGITLKDYEELYRQQNGLCAICEAVPPPGQRFHVDHDHTSGQIRGLLCTRCNPGIGLLRDSPDILRKAIAYLEKSRAEQKDQRSNVIEMRRG